MTYWPFFDRGSHIFCPTSKGLVKHRHSCPPHSLVPTHFARLSLRLRLSVCPSDRLSICASVIWCKIYLGGCGSGIFSKGNYGGRVEDSWLPAIKSWLRYQVQFSSTRSNAPTSQVPPPLASLLIHALLLPCSSCELFLLAPLDPHSSSCSSPSLCSVDFVKL